MLMPKEFEVIELPCGATGIWEGMGYRCETCMAIYGSIGCACSSESTEDL